MFLEEIRKIKSEKRDLRNFGLTIGIVLGLLSGLLWWKGKDTYTIFLFISLAFIFFGLFLPSALKLLQKAWMTLAVILGWFMTRIILSILFYLVFSSIGLILRAFGKQFINLRMDKSKKSFWIIRENKEFRKSDYERQF
jgi:hypothetical protein